jgi:hypothetical protein
MAVEEQYDFGADVFVKLEMAIIDLYNKGILTPTVLDAIASPWRGYEIPHIGLAPKVKDGRTFHEIVVHTLMGKTDDDWGNYLKIRRDRWGWR